jgi:transposase
VAQYRHRDINAAWNILAAGRRRLAEGIAVLSTPRAAAES